MTDFIGAFGRGLALGCVLLTAPVVWTTGHYLVAELVLLLGVLLSEKYHGFGPYAR